LLFRQSRVDDQLANFTNLISLKTGGGMCIWQLSLGQNPRTTMHAILCKLQTAKLRTSS
jgi:hypothetical protein